MFSISAKSVNSGRSSENMPSVAHTDDLCSSNRTISRMLTSDAVGGGIHTSGPRSSTHMCTGSVFILETKNAKRALGCFGLTMRADHNCPAAKAAFLHDVATDTKADRFAMKRLNRTSSWVNGRSGSKYSPHANWRISPKTSEGTKRI